MTIIYTITAAFILIGGALALIGIGYMLTGKSKIQPGSCGRAPSQKKDENCGNDVTCELCKPNSDNEDEKLHKEQSRDD